MSRLSKLPLDEWDPELRAATHADDRTALENGTLRYIAGRPQLARAMVDYAGALASDRLLDRRLIELVRLRIAFHNQCRSCMAIRYDDAVSAGVTEELVCSLERPSEATDLTDAEKAAIRYGDLFATNHLAIDDDVFDALRVHFGEAQIVELALNVAWFVGMGRLAATLHMVDELPATFQSGDVAAGSVAPWGNESIVVGARPPGTT